MRLTTCRAFDGAANYLDIRDRLDPYYVIAEHLPIPARDHDQVEACLPGWVVALACVERASRWTCLRRRLSLSKDRTNARMVNRRVCVRDSSSRDAME